ncbi:MAG: hypothetical protein V1709_09630 [Planctomycetota bacterium]
MFEKKFEVKLYVPENVEVSGDMPDRWAGNLKNSSEVINSRRQAKIPDDGTFILKMAGRAAQNFREFVNPAYTTKGGRNQEDVQNTHKSNIVVAFNSWNDKINKAFETQDGVPAKLFKQMIDASKDRWALRAGAKTLRLTGDKIRGRGVAPIASLYLAGDTRAKAWIREADYADGEPYSITQTGHEPTLKVAMQQRFVQGGLSVIDSEFSTSVLTRQNTMNTDILNGLRDPARCDAFVTTPAPDKCFCVWEMDGNILFLHIQVGVTIP